jgi:hypothetical protein
MRSRRKVKRRFALLVGGTPRSGAKEPFLNRQLKASGHFLAHCGPIAETRGMANAGLLSMRLKTSRDNEIPS